MANEKRLIDTKPLMQSGWHLVKTGNSNVFLAQMSLADVPTVDAVEVVRCEKCAFGHYLRGIKKYECHHPFYVERNRHSGTHFCSYGERREGE